MNKVKHTYINDLGTTVTTYLSSEAKDNLTSANKIVDSIERASPVLGVSIRENYRRELRGEETEKGIEIFMYFVGTFKLGLILDLDDAFKSKV